MNYLKNILSVTSLKRDYITDNFNLAISEQKKISEYEGMANVLQILKISPIEWNEIKNNKKKIKII